MYTCNRVKISYYFKDIKHNFFSIINLKYK